MRTNYSTMVVVYSFFKSCVYNNFNHIEYYKLITRDITTIYI